MAVRVGAHARAWGWLAALAAAPLPAQVVERHLPPAPVQSAPTIAPPPAPARSADATPIGPPLRALALIGPLDPVRSPAVGISSAAGLRIDATAAARLLSPYLGQPISRQLIADAGAAVTRFYRRQGFPFVSVTTPEQEIGTGALQLRVIEFRAGAIGTAGLSRTPAGWITSHIRLRPGDPIDANHLSEDVDWLNRDPFRQLSPVLSPGAALGESDVTLTATETPRPWRLFGGAETSGSVATGRARIFAGVQVAGPRWWPDATLSYQFTGAPDAFTSGHPDYLSHAVRATLPIAPRNAIELTYDHVETNQPVQDFRSRQRIDEAAIGWRGALTTLFPRLSSATLVDLDIGVEARHARRLLSFGGIGVDAASIDVAQLYAGFTATRADAHGTSQLTATLHASPGGIGRDGADADYVRFTGSPAASAHYAYLNGSATHTERLSAGLSASTQLIFQIAGKALPDTEQVSLGGPAAVRGYVIDDGGFDSAVIARNQLDGPTLSLARLAAGASVRPMLFVDAGHGRAHAPDLASTQIATGFGADAALGRHLQGSADLACALHDAGLTTAGHCRIEATLSITL